MTRDIAFLVNLFPLVSIADESIYLCTTKQILELSENGVMEKHTGVYKQFVDKQFSINRNTGEIVAPPFST
jgi:hypothetical protein